MSCLITINVDVLGERTGPTLEKLLRDRSPLASLAPELIIETVHLLEGTAGVTEDVVAAVCSRLLIDPARWPDPPPDTGFRLAPDVGAVVARLGELAPVAVVGALDCVTGPGHLAALTTALSTIPGASSRPVGVHAGYQWGVSAPDMRWWHYLASAYQTRAEQIIHIGTDLVRDVYSPLHAGARALYLHPDPGPDLPAGPDRAARVSGLPDAADVVRAWLR